jgi:hypothetical protein
MVCAPYKFCSDPPPGGDYMRGGLIAKGGLICQIIRYEDTFVAIFNFGGGRCSDEAHRLYFWLALDVGFGWPADSLGE